MNAYDKGARALHRFVTAWLPYLDAELMDYEEQAAELYLYHGAADLTISVDHQGYFNGCLDMWRLGLHLEYHARSKELDTLLKVLRGHYDHTRAKSDAQLQEECDLDRASPKITRMKSSPRLILI
jgi:hypothetical protein